MTRDFPCALATLATVAAILLGACSAEATLPPANQVVLRHEPAVEVPASASAARADSTFSVLLEDGTFAHYFNY